MYLSLNLAIKRETTEIIIIVIIMIITWKYTKFVNEKGMARQGFIVGKAHWIKGRAVNEESSILK